MYIYKICDKTTNGLRTFQGSRWDYYLRNKVKLIKIYYFVVSEIFCTV